AEIRQLADEEVVVLLGPWRQDVFGLLHPAKAPARLDRLGRERGDGGYERCWVLASFAEPDEPQPAKRHHLGHMIVLLTWAALVAEVDTTVSLDPRHNGQEGTLQLIEVAGR